MNKPSQRKADMAVQPYQRLVSLPIKSENIFHFPDGLPAFESVKEFIFIMRPDTQPFVFMHSLNPPDLAFVCVDPFLICREYLPKISDADRDFLGLKNQSDALLLAIVTVRDDVRECTANLQGPIVINIQNSIGRQVICEGQNYPVRYNIWNALDRLSEEPGQELSGRMKTALAGVQPV